MKALKQSKPSFSPFQISIIIETENDLTSLHKLIDCNDNGDCPCCRDLEGNQDTLMNVISKCLK